MSEFKVTEAEFQAALEKTQRLSRELDITNPDHIVLWLASNGPDEPISECAAWLACRIVEAYERATAAQGRER